MWEVALFEKIMWHFTQQIQFEEILKRNQGSPFIIKEKCPTPKILISIKYDKVEWKEVNKKSYISLTIKPFPGISF